MATGWLDYAHTSGFTPTPLGVRRPRIHGPTDARPEEMFPQLESRCLLPVPAPYDVPILGRVKVHRDYHEIARAIYSAPEHLIGHYLDGPRQQ